MSDANQAEKQSPDPMVQKLSRLLEADLKSRPEVFCIQNAQLFPDEIAAHDGLLGLFMFQAAEECQGAMQKKLPLVFESSETALIDVVPLTEATESNLFALWAHFVHYSLEELVRKAKKEKKLVNGMITLDELYRNCHKAVAEKKYAVRPRPAASVSMAQQQSN